MATYPHEIRLRGPWGCHVGSQGTTFTPPGSLHGLAIPTADSAVTLTRRFHWAARLEAHDVAWFELDRCYASGSVELNGVRLGEIGMPEPLFGIDRWDVTELLRDDNDVTLVLRPPEALRESSADLPTVWGPLGEIRLRVEHRGASGEPAVAAAWDDVAEVGTLHVSLPSIWHDATAIEAILDGGRLGPATVTEADGGEVTLVWHSGAGRVSPWLPRGEGLPRRHDVELRLRLPGNDEWAWSRRVGFRRAPADADQTERLPRDGRASYHTTFGCDPTVPFDETALGRHLRIGLIGHVGPDAFYDLCDRAGLLVWHDQLPEPMPAPTRRLLQRLAWHPCLALDAAGTLPAE